MRLVRDRSSLKNRVVSLIGREGQRVEAADPFGKKGRAQLELMELRPPTRTMVADYLAGIDLLTLQDQADRQEHSRGGLCGSGDRDPADHRRPGLLQRLCGPGGHRRDREVPAAQGLRGLYRFDAELSAVRGPDAGRPYHQAGSECLNKMGTHSGGAARHQAVGLPQASLPEDLFLVLGGQGQSGGGPRLVADYPACLDGGEARLPLS